MGQDENVGMSKRPEGPHARLGIDTAQFPDLIALRVEALQERVLVPPVADRDRIAPDEAIKIGQEGTGSIAGMLIKQFCINLLPQFRRQQNDPQMCGTRIQGTVNMQTPVIQTGSNMLLY